MRALLSVTATTASGVTTDPGYKFIEAEDRADLLRRAQIEVDNIADMYMASAMTNERYQPEEYKLDQQCSVEYEDGSYDYFATHYNHDDFLRAQASAQTYTLWFELPVFQGTHTISISLAKSLDYSVHDAAKALVVILEKGSESLFALSYALGQSFTLKLTDPQGTEHTHTFRLSDYPRSLKEEDHDKFAEWFNRPERAA